MAGHDHLHGFASHLADIARPIAARYFRAGLAIEDKADESPVTRADREIEAAMRKAIKEARPDDGIYGEEYGIENPDAEFVWVLDPIDGTKSFVTGKPLFGTLIGLMQKGRVALGVIDMPALNERWIGGPDHPTTYNGTSVRCRPCDDISKAWCYATTPDMFEGDNAAPYDRVQAAVKHPLYGADCYAYGLIASGTVDLVVEACLKPYDFVGPAGVIIGAGGVISDWSGKPVDLETDGRVVAAGDSRCQAAAINRLQG